MTPEPTELDDLHDLIDACCRGTIAGDQFARLTAMLRDNAEAQRAYLDYARLDGGLRWEYGAARRPARSGEGATPATAAAADMADPSVAIAIARPRRSAAASSRRPAARHPHRLTWPTYAMAAALLIAAGVGVGVYLAVVSDQPSSTAPTPPKSIARVATLTDAQGVTWVSDPLSPGDEITSGSIATEAGDAEFVFASGAQVSITGRVQMHIDNPMRVSMTMGRAAFICPPDAVGFTVELPDGVRVVDLSTEFSIDQRADGATIRVTQGRVRLHGVSGDGTPIQREMKHGELAQVVRGRFEVQPDTAGPLLATTGLVDAASVPPPATVPVGDPGNAADDTGFGRVNYEYRIARHEVTNEQYCAFLNAAARDDRYSLYHPQMAEQYGGIVRSGSPGAYVYTLKEGAAAKPVNFVSWLDAVRYANWLSNGRGGADTESGAYTIRAGHVTVQDHAVLADSPGVKWVLPTEDEWYKAAYYDPAKDGGAGYWRFATRTNAVPKANFNTDQIADVGQFPPSAYGTHDQNGNLWEWNELTTERGRGLRGGSFYLHDKIVYMRSTTRYDYIAPGDEQPNYGFRVVALGRGSIR